MDEQKGKRRKRRMWMCNADGLHGTIFFEGLAQEDCPVCQMRCRLDALLEKLGAECKPAAQG